LKRVTEAKVEKTNAFPPFTALESVPTLSAVQREVETYATPKAYANLGATLYFEGYIDAAICAYTKAIDRDPSNYRYYASRGYIHHVQGHTNQAHKDYCKAATCWQHADHMVLALRSCTFNSKGLYCLALEDSKASLDLNQSARAYTSKAFSMANLGKFHTILRNNPGMLTASLENYEKALSLNPNYSRAWAYKGYSLFKMNRMEEAIACCNQCLKMSPTDVPDAYYIRGCILQNQGRMHLAAKDFTEFLSIFHKAKFFTREMAEAMKKMCR
jgi:tetratricopeptide (TPR) repeat protein